MALGLELKLRMGMQLVMTPQLQLAIRLLQMSSLELNDYLQKELEQNPLLEPDGEGGGMMGEAAPATVGLEGSAATREEGEKKEAARKERDDNQAEAALDRMSDSERLHDDLPLDAQWSDVYGDGYGGGGYEGGGAGGAEAPPIENTLTRGDSLADHLIWQLNLSVQDERQRALGLTIIDAVDDNGYLTSDLETLARIAEAEPGEMAAALALVQSFEPPGVAARNLADCLRLQLEGMGLAHEPYLGLLAHLDDLARRDFRKLGRLLRLSEDELAAAVAVIQSLNPKPGLAFGSDQAAYVVPDVFVRQVEGEWQVEFNYDTVPRLRINRLYQDALSGRMRGADRQFISDNSRSAQWLIKSLEQRSRTIHKVAESIVRFQSEFLEKGPEYLKPLILKDVAEDVGVHESTISRVTSNKYMHTPRGIFELKYFFSSSLPSDDGDAHSAEAVKFKIRKLVEEESPRRPLSDEKLVQLLSEQGVKVARRTVAKYREALGIPSSSRRKRLS